MAPSNPQAKQAESEEDRALIEAAKKGDTRAFRCLVERHQHRAYAIAFAMVRNEQDARDIVQEGFLRVHRSLPNFAGNAIFFTWFYRIITNLCIDLLRKPGRKTMELATLDERADSLVPADCEFPLLQKFENGNPLETLHRAQVLKKIHDALETLSPLHRGAILLREVEGMSYEEMAEAMGVSQGTIMSRLFHARQKLQRALRDFYLESQNTNPLNHVAGDLK